MKKTFVFLALVILGSPLLKAQIILSNLGSSTFDVEVSQGSFLQTTSAIEWTGDMQAADMVGGFFATPLDLSSYTTSPWQFGVAMSISGTDPDVSFTGEFVDSNFNSAVYAGSTPNIVDGIALLDFDHSDPSFDYTNVVGFELTWGGTGTEPATILTATDLVVTNGSAVPEPETWGMLFLGLGLSALYAWRVKRIGRITVSR